MIRLSELLNEKIKFLLYVIATFYIHLFFLALWLIPRYFFNKYIEAKFGLKAYDDILLKVIIIGFDLTTIAPLLFFFYFDLSVIWKKLKKHFSKLIEKQDQNVS